MNLENGRLDINGFEKEEKRNNEGKIIYQKLVSKTDDLILEYIVDFVNDKVVKETYKSSKERLNYIVVNHLTGNRINDYRPREIFYEYADGKKSCYRLENNQKTLDAAWNEANQQIHNWEETGKHSRMERWCEYSAEGLLVNEILINQDNISGYEIPKTSIRNTIYEYELKNHKVKEIITSVNSKGELIHREVINSCSDNREIIIDEIEE